MKEKIIIFVIGLLLGAIISTGSIYVYNLVTNSNSDSNNSMQMGQNGNGGTPPEIPSGETTTQSSN